MDAALTLVDPVLAHGCAAALALILLHGAWAKLADNATFRATVELYEVLPAALVGPFARLFPLAEVVAAVALLARIEGIGLLLPAAVIVLSSLGIFINLLRGRTDLECGCGGDSHPRLSWALLARNGLLLAGVAIGAAAESGRDLVWIDYLSVAGLTLALAGLYAAANQLLANQPHTLQTRSQS